MKKYQQLILAIITVFSFSCFLIYRHEYNKLRYVLEVFNFFGTPGVSTSMSSTCSQGFMYKNQKFTENPLPMWQRISNTLYVYSAYWETIDNKQHVKAFAVGVLNENLNYGCYVWYDANSKTQTGLFNFVEISYKFQNSVYNKNFGKNRFKAFEFYCEVQSKNGAPVIVSFYEATQNETSQGLLPVIILPGKKPPQNLTSICVMPTPFPSFNKSMYLEFLSFHKILGIDNFIVYGAQDKHNLLHHISQDRSNNINLTVLPWNYPFYGNVELMRIIAENDCKIRAAGFYENVVIIDWNKFIVPRHIFSISKILNELDSEKTTYKFQLSTLLFCLEYPDVSYLNITSPLILRKSRYSLPKYDSPVPVYRPHLRSGKVQKVGKDVIAVHQYSSCRDIKIKSGGKKSDRVDAVMLKFQNKLLHSKLLLL